MCAHPPHGLNNDQNVCRSRVITHRQSNMWGLRTAKAIRDGCDKGVITGR